MKIPDHAVIRAEVISEDWLAEIVSDDSPNELRRTEVWRSITGPR